MEKYLWWVKHDVEKRLLFKIEAKTEFLAA